MKKAALVFVAFACACSRTSAPRLHEAAPAALKDGWTTLESMDGKVSIGLPPAFHTALERPEAPGLQLPTSPSEKGSGEVQEEQRRLLENLKEINSGFESAELKKIADEMERDHLVILAWDYARPTSGEERTSISVRREKDVSHRDLEEAALREKENMGGDILSEKVSLPIGEAVHLSTRYRNRIGDDISEIRYVLLDGADEYVIRLVATNAGSNIEPFADDVAKSLRVKPATT